MPGIAGRSICNSRGAAMPRWRRFRPPHASSSSRYVPGSILTRHGFHCNFYILISEPVFYSRVRCKTERAARAAGEIFTLQFGHVITLDISARSATDAPWVQFMQSAPCLISSRIFCANDAALSPLFCANFSVNRVSNGLKKKIDASRCRAFAREYLRKYLYSHMSK